MPDPSGQAIAAEYFLLQPVVWGWITAGVAATGALATWILRRPAALEPVDEPDAELVEPVEPVELEDAPTESAPSHLPLDPATAALAPLPAPIPPSSAAGSAPIPAAATGWLRWAVPAVILAVCLVHLPGVFGDFNIFDDKRQIHWDKTITQLTAENLRTVLLDNYKGTNQQLMYLSFQLNWAVAKNAYASWYLVNLVVFAGMLGFLYRFASRLLDSPRQALLAVGLFGTAPLTSEMLCWISVRSHLFGLFFTLGSLAAYMEWRRRDRGGIWLLLSVLAFAGSQMSKPIFLYLPVWLVLIDLWERRRDWKVAIVDKIPFALVAAYFLSQILEGGQSHGRIGRSPLGGSYLATLQTDLNLLVEYLRSLIIPYETGVLPPFNVAEGWFAVQGVPMVLPNGFAPLASLVILLSVLAAAVAVAVRFRWTLPLLVLAASLVSFATVLNVPFRGNAAVFEYRYTLSAHVMFAILGANALALLARTKLASVGAGRHVPVALATAMLVWSSTVAHAETKMWASSFDYWTRTAELYPRSYFAHYYSAKASQHAKRFHRAIDHLDAAMIAGPKDEEVWRRYADSYYDVGMLEQAREPYIRYYSKRRSKIEGKIKERMDALGITDQEMREWRRRNR